MGFVFEIVKSLLAFGNVLTQNLNLASVFAWLSSLIPPA